MTTIPEYPTPKALFSCSRDYCRAEVSYEANQLFWYAPERRWVCQECWPNLPLADEEHEPTRGISLEDYLRARNLPATALLRGCP